MFRNFFEMISKYRCFFFQQQVITHPVTAKSVVITDDDGMRMKFVDQEITYIVLRRLVGKCIGERYYHNMIDAVLSKQN